MSYLYYEQKTIQKEKNQYIWINAGPGKQMIPDENSSKWYD